MAISNGIEIPRDQRDRCFGRQEERFKTGRGPWSGRPDGMRSPRPSRHRERAGEGGEARGGGWCQVAACAWSVGECDSANRNLPLHARAAQPPSTETGRRSQIAGSRKSDEEMVGWFAGWVRCPAS